MIERKLADVIREAVLRADLGPAPDRIEVTRPRQKEHGDYATNVALVLAKRAGRPPRDLAVDIASRVDSDLVVKVQVAGPGFINLFVTHHWLYEVLERIRREGDAYGREPMEETEAIQVEFVSTNPTGPLHVGHARGAVVGDALARVLEAAGHRVQREYYVNDAGAQARLFGASIEARVMELVGRPGEVPEGGYQGEYVKEIAASILEREGEGLLELTRDERVGRLAALGIEESLAGIRATLERFGIRFDHWFHESTLHERGEIDRVVSQLRERDLAYEKDGAIWFRATSYGDEKDRVLIRATGEPTYFAADCAYVEDKFGRGFDRLIYVWGADHHGTVKRLLGAAHALGHDPAMVEIILTQLVALYREGEPARMSKRTGEIITLDELLDEVGADAARYTLLSRSVDSQLDFDIELVKRQTLDNPVYYVQYAHARIASLLRFAVERGAEMGPVEGAPFGELIHETELDLLRELAELPEQLRLAAEARAPYRLSRYIEEVAASFHRFYTECRVVTEDEPLTRARLHLAEAARQVLANGLAILGVSAPDSMERLEEPG